jgi:malonyl CoA-acyl carrier protein transacylase
MPRTDGATALLFPGQGVGDGSARELVAETCPRLLALAKEMIGEDPFERIAEGTRFAQPAVYCASIAGYESLGRPSVEHFAGHSLGEIAALAASGAIDDEAGLRIVVARALAMDEAARLGPRGGMLAVGTDRRRAGALAAAHLLVLANENSPRQYVLSGPLAGIEAAQKEAKAARVRAKKLAVAGAFHTEAMLPAAMPFRAALSKVEFRYTSTPAISSTTARFFGAGVKDVLTDSLTMPVRWVKVVRKLHDLGATRFVDVGPGSVLAGLVRRILSDVEIESVAHRESAVA